MFFSDDVALPLSANVENSPLFYVALPVRVMSWYKLFVKQVSIAKHCMAAELCMENWRTEVAY